jgi:hypothetical protein
MKFATPIAFVLFATCLAGALGSLIMTFVFCYVPHIIYPHPIVNVEAATPTTVSPIFQIHLRCDLAQSGYYRARLLQNCNTSLYSVEPNCNTPPSAGYVLAAYAFGQLECTTGYLSGFYPVVNLNVNLIALATCMMIISTLLFLLPFFIVWCREKRN